MNRRTLFIAIGFVLATGCGNCGDEPGNDAGPGGDSFAMQDGVVEDGLTTDGDGGGSGGMDTDMASDGQTGADGDGQSMMSGDGMSKMDGGGQKCKNVNTWTNRNHCGKCGNACASEQICNNGKCKCPDYHDFCNGKCVATNLDPNNCGSCGNTCSGSKVCSGGQCVDSCPTTFNKCGNQCVDLDTNDDNCGMCGKSCPKNKGCSQGTCVDLVVPGGKTPAKCKGGGPPINIGFKPSNMQKKCSGKVAKTTFKWGLCSCNDVNFMNNFFVDGYDSKAGPYQQGGYGGGVGTNGKFTAGKGEIWGALWTSSNKGISSGPKLVVKQQLHSQGDLNWSVRGRVEDDAWVGGNVTASTPGGPPFKFQKKLTIPNGNSIHRRAQTNNVVRKPVSVSTVCKRCQAGKRIPVKQIVKNHKNNNDNAAIGLKKNALDNPGKKVVLKLPCGKYYLSKIDVSSKITIIAEGRTALFIDGNVNSQTDITIKPTPSAQLDVFVNGKVTLANEMEIGSPAYPAAMRFYVNDEWSFMNSAVIGAYIYAIPGGITTMNTLEVFGGLYTHDIQAMNELKIHYDREVLEADKKCPTPNPNPKPNPDAGMSDSGGTTTDSGGTKMDSGTTTKMDGGGGTNMCSEAGQSCSADGDCCSPLVCDNGTCDTSQCKNLYETCSSNGDCCSGICATSGGTSVCTGS